MATERKKMSFTLEEVLGHFPVPNEELEIDRTNDMADSSDPNWETPYKRWTMGLRNSNDTKLANIIAGKTKDAFGLSEFLDFVQRSQAQVFQFMLEVVTKLLSHNTSNNGS